MWVSIPNRKRVRGIESQKFLSWRMEDDQQKAMRKMLGMETKAYSIIQGILSQNKQGLPYDFEK